ncbi:MAG TPA: hypothetical protein DCQ06_09700 [Myxococcales bacterium]|nr:hypothetical protein [Myxococcales bacterium]HAN31858.1 hypothetical protein [Myxococcales bacterium]
MSTPLLCLLIFALWTVSLVIVGVGGYRIPPIVAGRKRANAFAADVEHGGPGWYRRCVRAHMNCVENLPVFGAVVLIGAVAGIATERLDMLAMAYVAARVLQSLIHIASGSSAAVSARFGFFVVQLLCIGAMSWELWSHAS